MSKFRDPFHVMSAEDLQSANYGISKSRYQQVSASREVSGTSFAGKQISYKFSTSSNQWWSPSESFLKGEFELYKVNKTQLVVADDCAPTTGMMANLFQSAELRIGGVVISRASDNLGQVDAYIHRSRKSDGWMKSIGASVNFYGESYEKRLNTVSSDGTIPSVSAFPGGDAIDLPTALTAVNALKVGSRQIMKFELIWDLAPLSIFLSKANIPPGVEVELLLNPYGSDSFKNSAVQSVSDKAAGTDFDLNVVNMIFYAKIIEGRSFDGVAYLDLDNTTCQGEEILNQAFAQKTYEVSPSTHMLAVAIQDAQLNTTRRSASEFIVNGDEQDLLTRLVVGYDGQQQPQPDADPSFVPGADRTNQRYLETQQAIGAYDSEAGGESLEQWHERGMYYAFKFNRDGNSAATRVSVHTAFSIKPTNARLLLLASSYANARLTFANGRMIEAVVEDA